MSRVVAAMMVAIALSACSRESEPLPAAAPTPVAATQIAPPSAASMPAPAGATPAPGETEEPLPNLEDLLEDKPTGADFEIDAAASAYFAPVGSTVSFRAKALNGSPPIKFTWTFGDGSPEQYGERVEHTYNKLGQIRALVVGEDANKAQSRVQFVMLFVTAEQFVESQRLDPKIIKGTPGPNVETPGPATPTPARTAATPRPPGP